MKVLIIFCLMISPCFAQLDVNELIATGDSLFKTFNNEGALEAYLGALEIDSTNYEASWKASRAFLDIGETLVDDPRAAHYKRGEIYSRKAIQIDSLDSKGHLYLSIALGRVALDASAKKRIQLSKEIKKEVDLAIKYNPNDDSAYHVLGRWNRKLANLSWIERGFANLFLGGVPEEASNQNAVECFKKAIEIKSGHINHHLELGKTYEMMDSYNKAREEYNKCLELPKTDSDDDKYKEEAKQLLEDL